MRVIQVQHHVRCACVPAVDWVDLHSVLLRYKDVTIALPVFVEAHVDAILHYAAQLAQVIILVVDITHGIGQLSQPILAAD
jgi:hypothetical protein